MSRGIYYGGYFGRCVSFIPNPFHPYVRAHWSEFFPEDEAPEKEQKADSQYKQYLHRLVVAYREAMKNAKSEREYWTLHERLNHYWHKWDSQG